MIIATNDYVRPVNPNPDKKFSAMNAGEKLVFFAKLIIMFITFGFVFGNLLADD